MKKPAWKRYLDFWGRDLKREVEQEFEFHLEMRARELIDRGLAPEEAQRQAAEYFGHRESLKKECTVIQHRWHQQSRLQGAFNEMLRDFLFALRQFRTRRSTSLTVVLTLGLGIGINTAVFSLVQNVLLSPLPYPHAEELIRVWDRNVEMDLLYFSVSAPHFEAWREAETLAAVGAYREDSFNLRSDSGIDSIRGARITADLLEVLSLIPESGRNLGLADDIPGADGVVMLSHGLKSRFFGDSTDPSGNSVTLDGKPYRIVGVLPRDFKFPQQPGVELVIPYQLDFSTIGGTSHFLRVLGRLAPGISLEAASQELTQLAANSDREQSEGGKGWKVVARDLQEATVAEARGSLLLLMGAVLALLLIACCNVTQLYLVRGVAREREFALRAALGAGRFTLIRQLLMEALVVSLAGAFVGASVGWLGQRVLVSFLPADLPRRNEAVFNWEVALFGFFLALCCGLMVGWFQARFASRAIRPALNSRQGGGLSRRMTRVLVAAEVAVSLALLVGGALLTQSFVRLGRVDPGFATASVSRASMTSLASGPEQGPERIRLMAGFWQELTQVGGVEAAALVHRLPLDGNSAVSLRPRESTWDDREPMWVNYRAVSPGYFDVLGISFLEGRDFEFEEAWQEPRGIVLNRALSEFFWPGQEGVGKRLGMSAEGPWFEVLGVVADVHEEDLSSPPQPAAYIPYVMAPVPAMEILVRGPRSPADLSRETSAVLGRLAPFQAVTPFQPMDEFMQSLRAQPRAGGVLLSTFALLATLLALLGVVGLVSATVAGRMHELGVRLVLGATPGGVTRMTFRDGLLSAAAGVPLGLFLAWLGSRWLSAYVFEVSATDPVTYLVVSALLLMGAGLAAYLPARRAARIDPRQVLDTQG